MDRDTEIVDRLRMNVSPMSSPLTLENSLILACVRTEPDVQRIRELVERCPEWPLIVRKAERWRVVPSLYLQLRQGAQSGRVPGPVTEGLKQLYYRDTIRSVAKRELLRAALLRFAEASVPVIVLRGAALATLVYQSHALRPARKIELLVHRRDLARVEAVLCSLPEAPGTPVGGSQGYALFDVRHDIFDRSSVEEMPAAVRIPIEDFWARARRVQIASVPTLVFAHEDLLLHLAMHLTADAFVGRVRTLCDIGETCRRYSDAIDWSQLIARACAYDLAKPLYYSLRLARELVGAGVPSQALMALRARFNQLPLEDRFIAAGARQALLCDAQSMSRLATVTALGVRLLLSRRARDGLTLVGHHLARTCESSLRRLTRADPSPSHGAGSGSTNSLRTRQARAHPKFYGDRLVDTQGDVAVTYDQNASDGLGSQLQRIYGLYALSRALDIKYVHTPLGQVDYQGLMPLLAGRSDPDFAARCNSFFALPSDDFDLDGCERLLLPHPNEKRIEQYRRYAAAIGRPVLLRAHEPYGYTDPHPEAYLALRAVSPYRDFRSEGPIRICVHMRRGDRVLSQDPRLLSNGYYLRACEAVVNALQQQRVSFVVRLHTEAPSRSCTVYPGFPGLLVDFNEPSTLDSAAHSLEEFKPLPNLTMVLNVEPKQALDDFATADVLILSCSCLGYVGGLLNPHGLVISAPDLPPPRNFHAALPDWLVADEQGNVDATQLAARVAGLLQSP
jgi:Uncharacterised nucleotidyltransferase